MTCFGANVFDRAPLAAEAPHRGASFKLVKKKKISSKLLALCPYGGGKRGPIKAPYRGAQ